MPEPVTFIITSSNRFDLLEKTLDSFLALNSYPIERYILNEDSGKVETCNKILQKYGNLFNILYHPHKEGLSMALDNLFRNVNTEYVFTCEDDWLFYKNPHFIVQSLEILKSRQDIHQVWIRDHTDHKHPLGTLESIGSVNVNPVLKQYQGHWGGFTFNPGLRRMSDIRRFFPNGFSEFGDEMLCSKHVEKMGYCAVSLEQSSIRHIGWNRHTENFKA